MDKEEMLKQVESIKAQAQAQGISPADPQGIYMVARPPYMGAGAGMSRIRFEEPERICDVSAYRADGTKIPFPETMLMGRLRRDSILASVLQHVHIAVMPEKTFVTLYKGNEMTTLEDSTAMFPSDNLVNAMRLLFG
jgi:hypothetical protein